MKIKLFLDGAELRPMQAADAARQVENFTTAPTLMRKAGTTYYEAFVQKLTTLSEQVRP